MKLQLLLLLINAILATSFVIQSTFNRYELCRLFEQDDNEGEQQVKNPFVKASWFAVESFGQIFGTNKMKSKLNDEKAESEIDFSIGPSSLEEALKRIELDNARSYFLSGEVDLNAYDEECIFADPFVSFAGRQRFVDNLANLGSFITKYDAKFLGYDVLEDGYQVQTKVRRNESIRRHICISFRYDLTCTSLYQIKGDGQIGTEFAMEACFSLALGGKVYH